MSERWRVGHKVPINIYEGDNPGRPICQVHNEGDARRIVDAVNATLGPHKWSMAGFCMNCGATWSAGVELPCPGGRSGGP